MQLSKTVVFAEGSLPLERLVAEASGLSDEVVAIHVGPPDEAAAVAAAGARVVTLGERPATAMLEAFAPAIATVVAEEQPDLVLIRPTKRARAIAGALSVAVSAPVVSDVSRISGEAGNLEFERLTYGGAAVRTVTVAGPAIALVPAGVLEPVAAGRAGQVVARSAEVASGPMVVASEPKQEESAELGAARIVIGVGRGIGSEENVAAIVAAARNLGAEVACSRPIAEGVGWMAKSRYLGVSGATIKPDVYLALGISGQVQHMIGVSGAKKIVAINKDKSAPIFDVCDLGLIDDLTRYVNDLPDRLS